MKKIMYMLLIAGSWTLSAQTSKTVATIHGEKIAYNMRMTTQQRNDMVANSTPSVGTMIFNTTTNCHEFFDHTQKWYNLCWGGYNATVTNVVCTGADAGILQIGTAPTGVTKTVLVTTNGGGTFTIETNTVYGVKFSQTETFAGAETKNVILTAINTPTTASTNATFKIQGSSGTFTRVITGAIGDGTVVTATGRIWQDKNLGAAQVATSATDHLGYGDFYQWGRSGSDGHQIVNWTSSTTGTVNGATTTQSLTNIPENGLFITASFDWRATQNDLLWQGTTGINNPCPSGYRLPTETEWTAEFTAAEITNIATAYGSVLKLATAGYRGNDGMLATAGSYGYYWSSTVDGIYAKPRYFNSNSSTGANGGYRSYGFSVRCIKD